MVVGLGYSIPAAKRVGDFTGRVRPLSAWQKIVLAFQWVVLTIAFSAFCAASIIGIYYIAGWFDNVSYKILSIFLVLILDANIASRYFIWCETH